MTKADIRLAILEQLRSELALITRAALLARDEAISEESRAENKYDTRGQEAAYLAEGQGRLAGEIENSIAVYTTLPLPDFSPGQEIAVGALVEVKSAAGRQRYFLGPRAGGLEIADAAGSILVITPSSPIGRQLAGRRVGDLITAPGRSSPNLRITRAD